MAEPSEVDMDALVQVVTDAEYYEGEDPDWPEWLAEQDVDSLMELIAAFKAESRRVAKVRAELKERLAMALGEGGRATDGHTFYRNVSPHKRLLADADEFWRIVALRPDMVFNAGDVKITGLRTLLLRYADSHGVEPDDQQEWADNLEKRLFKYRPDGPPKVTDMPMDRAPLYSRKMEPGAAYGPDIARKGK